MALVPLGLDQTRNILLRGGVDLFYGRAVDHLLEGADQQALQQALFDPIEGLQGGLSWSLGAPPRYAGRLQGLPTVPGQRSGQPEGPGCLRGAFQGVLGCRPHPCRNMLLARPGSVHEFTVYIAGSYAIAGESFTNTMNWGSPSRRARWRGRWTGN
jgi:hypothetical protein